SFLFSGTVGENILFGRPSATRGQMEQAARAIGAHDFIMAMPNGYDTDVRRRGVRLSSGQRQLVAFARAFLADPRVLILDEATSSLDLPSERLVQRALRTLLRGRTAFIIAHRLSTVEVADRVLVLDAGRIVEDGAPAELRRGEGRYSSLHGASVDDRAHGWVQRQAGAPRRLAVDRGEDDAPVPRRKLVRPPSFQGAAGPRRGLKGFAVNRVGRPEGVGIRQRVMHFQAFDQ